MEAMDNETKKPGLPACRAKRHDGPQGRFPDHPPAGRKPEDGPWQMEER